MADEYIMNPIIGEGLRIAIRKEISIKHRLSKNYRHCMLLLWAVWACKTRINGPFSLINIRLPPAKPPHLQKTDRSLIL